jgi:hypothetical protein
MYYFELVTGKTTVSTVRTYTYLETNTIVSCAPLGTGGILTWLTDALVLSLAQKQPTCTDGMELTWIGWSDMALFAYQYHTPLAWVAHSTLHNQEINGIGIGIGTSTYMVPP